MSFDPISIALSKPKVFDLNSYKGVVTGEGQFKGAELSLTEAIQYAYGLGESFTLESAEIDDFENEVDNCNKKMKFKLSLNGNTHLLSPSDIVTTERGKILSFYLFVVDQDPIIKMGFCISTDRGSDGSGENEKLYPGILITAKAL